MIKKTLLSFLGLLLGVGIGYGAIYIQNSSLTFSITKTQPTPSLDQKNRVVIGFLPYWLLTKAKTDYSNYITNLTVFGLTIDSDGTIKKFTKPGEGEPGWVALNRGKFDPFIENAKSSNMELSLLFFMSNEDSISALLEYPKQNARNLVADAVPVMKEKGFTDFNLDIESIPEASEEARMSFTTFTQELKKGLTENGINSLTVEATGTDFVKKKLIDVNAIGKIADRMVIMAYDYHNPGSYVTGPVSPLFGGGSYSEYDVETAVKQAEIYMPPDKIILGIPLYGYEWEAIGNFPRAATIPGTGITASNSRAEETLSSCDDCNKFKDSVSHESYIVTRESSGIYSQIFYPDEADTQEKVKFANESKIGGLALWALGYEGDNILKPLTSYIE